MSKSFVRPSLRSSRSSSQIHDLEDIGSHIPASLNANNVPVASLEPQSQITEEEAVACLLRALMATGYKSKVELEQLWNEIIQRKQISFKIEEVVISYYLPDYY